MVLPPADDLERDSDIPHEPPWWQRLPQLAGLPAPVMLLVVAVVQREDGEFVADALTSQGYPVTRLRTAGGFLRQGNETLLLGVPAGALPGVLESIRLHCRTRTEVLVPDTVEEFGTSWTGTPITVTVGGATVFILPIERYERLAGCRPGAACSPSAAASLARGGTMEDGTKLIIAIVHADDADRAIRALLEQQIRVTRINTVGGFLKRGNVTLLVGVDAALVDTVIETLSKVVSRTHVSQPSSASPDQAARATIFVLGTQRFLQI